MLTCVTASAHGTITATPTRPCATIGFPRAALRSVNRHPPTTGNCRCGPHRALRGLPGDGFPPTRRPDVGAGVVRDLALRGSRRICASASLLRRWSTSETSLRLNGFALNGLADETPTRRAHFDCSKRLQLTVQRHVDFARTCRTDSAAPKAALERRAEPAQAPLRRRTAATQQRDGHRAGTRHIARQTAGQHDFG